MESQLFFLNKHFLNVLFFSSSSFPEDKLYYRLFSETIFSNCCGRYILTAKYWDYLLKKHWEFWVPRFPYCAERILSKLSDKFNIKHWNIENLNIACFIDNNIQQICRTGEFLTLSASDITTPVFQLMHI